MRDADVTRVYAMLGTRLPRFARTRVWSDVISEIESCKVGPGNSIRLYSVLAPRWLSHAPGVQGLVRLVSPLGSRSLCLSLRVSYRQWTMGLTMLMRWPTSSCRRCALAVGDGGCRWVPPEYGTTPLAVSKPGRHEQRHRNFILQHGFTHRPGRAPQKLSLIHI